MSTNHIQDDQVAIIGGGIAGCATAYLLANAGFRVSIFEQAAQLATAGSGNPAAMLYPRTSGQNLNSQFAVQAYQFSLAFYQSLALSKQDFQQCGLLQLAYNKQASDRIQKAAQAFPTIAKLVSADEASQIAGIDCEFAALHLPEAGWVVPGALCQRLISHPNIAVHCNTKVTQLSVTKNTAQIGHANSVIGTFDQVVLCNAQLANQFEQTQHLAVDAMRGQISLLPPDQSSRSLKTILCTDGYLSPEIHGQHSLGASFNDNTNDLILSKDEHKQNLDKLAALAPSLYHLTCSSKQGRVGIRAISKDRLPLVGGVINATNIQNPTPRANLKENNLPWHPRLWVNTAHGSHGFINAPFSAHLLCQLITRTSPEETSLNMLARLNPNRFLLRKLGLKKLARTVADANAKRLHFSPSDLLS